jgi:hypothetical protein
MNGAIEYEGASVAGHWHPGGLVMIDKIVMINQDEKYGHSLICLTTGDAVRTSATLKILQQRINERITAVAVEAERAVHFGMVEVGPR